MCPGGKLAGLCPEHDVKLLPLIDACGTRVPYKVARFGNWQAHRLLIELTLRKLEYKQGSFQPPHGRKSVQWLLPIKVLNIRRKNRQLSTPLAEK